MIEDKNLPCEIQCMVFNETAYSICNEIPKEDLRKVKPHSIMLGQDDMSKIEVGEFAENPVICKEGWGLNDF